MAFAKQRDDSSSSQKKKISSILENFLPNSKKSTPLINKILQKRTTNHHSIDKNREKINNQVSFSEIKPKNQRNNNIKDSRSYIETDEFSYLDKIKRKIEKTLNFDKTIKKTEEYPEENNGLEDSHEESSTVKESLHKLQLKDAVNRQEIVKLKSLNDKLAKKVMELEDIIENFRNNQEKEGKAFTVLERELSNEKKKAGTLEAKLRKINPVKTAQLFQEILIKNECLLQEKNELEELLKQMLLDKEISRLKSINDIPLQKIQQKLIIPSKLDNNNSPLFKENEPQKPYEITSKQQKYEYNNNDEPKKCLYERLGEYEGISLVVDLFYKKILADIRVNGFYSGIDMERLHKNQKNFLCKITGGPDHYTGKGLEEGHQHLKITDYHFDIIKDHLISSLSELNVERINIEEIEDIFEKSRKACFYSPGFSVKQRDPEKITKGYNETLKESIDILKKSTNSLENLKKSSNPIQITVMKQSNEEESVRYLQEIHSQSPQRFEQSLYLKLGGFDKITALVEALYIRQLNDVRIKKLYENSDITRLHHNMKYFLTKIFGGPDIFVGCSLKDCDQNMCNSSYFCEISFENFQKAAISLSIKDEYIEKALKILNEKKDLSLSKSQQTPSLYELLGGYKSISLLIDGLYRRLIEQLPIENKEEYEKMKQNQKFYLTKVLGGPDTFLGENSRFFWKDPWFLKMGANQWLMALEEALKEIGAGKEIYEKIKDILKNEIY